MTPPVRSGQFRPGPLRRLLANPASPAVALLVGLATTMLAGARWPLWLLLGGVAGYSLSGSV